MMVVTSVQAQNRFGQLLDTVLREPITITRHGRAAAFIVSPHDMDELIDARRKRSKAVAEFEAWSEQARLSALPAAAELTDEDVVRLVKQDTSPMFRHLLKSKIHRATVTHCELHYEGSCAIDEDLLDVSDIRENEQVHIWNINNSERFITYAIRAERGSGIVSLNGSAARRATVGDLIIIAAFGMVNDSQPAPHVPSLVFVDAHNRVSEVKHAVAVQTPSSDESPAF